MMPGVFFRGGHLSGKLLKPPGVFVSRRHVSLALQQLPAAMITLTDASVSAVSASNRHVHSPACPPVPAVGWFCLTDLYLCSGWRAQRQLGPRGGHGGIWRSFSTDQVGAGHEPGRSAAAFKQPCEDIWLELSSQV